MLISVKSDFLMGEMEEIFVFEEKCKKYSFVLFT